MMDRIAQAEAGFRSLTEAIDTTTPAGRMLMQMVGSCAECERAMIRERTQAGLALARAEGRRGGRRPKLGPQQQAAIVDMVRAGRQTQAAAARLFRVHPATVSRLVAMQQQAEPTAVHTDGARVNASVAHDRCVCPSGPQGWTDRVTPCAPKTGPFNPPIYTHKIALNQGKPCRQDKGRFLVAALGVLMIFLSQESPRSHKQSATS